jgi:lysophospholipase L1-like esterase
VRSRLRPALVIQAILIVVLMSVILIRELDHYKRINQFRLDPLEQSKLHGLLGSGDNDLWIIGDSRAEQWNDFFPHLINTNVYDLGIAGQSTKQVLERFEDNLETHCPKYVVIQVGINDLKNIGLLDGKRIAANCLENTVRIVDLCKRRGIIAVYTSIFPVGTVSFYRKPFWDESIRDSIRYINMKVKEYCFDKGMYYFDSYSFLSDKQDPDIVKPEYQRDFLHLNREGYELLSAKLAGFLSDNSILKSE